MLRLLPLVALLGACSAPGSPRPEPVAADPSVVNLDNFRRVETDLYLQRFVDLGSFGRFVHAREPVPVEDQAVIRMNRDTLYSQAVVDLEASPATVVLPDADGRFMSLQVIDEDHYTPAVVYGPGEHVFTRRSVGTRYACFLVRTFLDPQDPDDVAEVHELQDRLEIRQDDPGSFSVPAWDTERAAALRGALNDLALANGGIDSSRMFGARDVVDPVQHLVGTAAGWGGNPVRAAYYEGVTPERNDGRTAHRLTVGDVPVDGFWSVTVYGPDGFLVPNAEGVHSLNSVTSERDADGTVTIRFGRCEDGVANCIPISPGWNYLVRMYRPREEILDGSWSFPRAEPVE